MRKVSKGRALEKFPSQIRYLGIKSGLTSTYCYISKNNWRIKNYWSLLLFELIGGAENIENVQNKDTISKNLLSFLNEIISLKNLRIDGTDFYVNYKVWEMFQREDHWKNGLVRLDIVEKNWFQLVHIVL